MSDAPQDHPQEEPPQAQWLARLLGELSEEDAARVDRLVASSDRSKEEFDRLDVFVQQARSTSELAPPANGLARLQARIAHERRTHERKARPSGSGAGSSKQGSVLSDADGEMLTAMVLGEPVLGDLEGEERARVAVDSSLAAERDAIAELILCARSAQEITPAPASFAEILKAVRAAPTDKQESGKQESGDTDKVPAPVRDATPPRRIRFLSWVLPLAAAAGLVIAVLIEDGAPTAARVETGRVLVLPKGAAQGPEGAARGVERWIDRTDGPVPFEVGDELRARAQPVSITVQCGDAPETTEPARHGMAGGEARLDLAPGARVRRLSVNEFELAAGSATVTSGRLREPLVLRHGHLYAEVKGTIFKAIVLENDPATIGDERLVVVVIDGSVELGRTPETDGSGAGSVTLEAGNQGLVDGSRLLEMSAGERAGPHAFLTPKVVVDPPQTPVPAGNDLILVTHLEPGPGGAVWIAPFDDSQPGFVVRLKGPDGHEREHKLVRSMVSGSLPAPDRDRRAHLVAVGRPYKVTFRIPGLGLTPGRWEARVRYTSYKRSAETVTVQIGTTRTVPKKTGIGHEEPWLGVVESAAIRVEVTE